MDKRAQIIMQLRQKPGSTAREIAHALGYIDGRDVATQLKLMVREGGVSATPEKLDANGVQIRTRYRIKDAR